MSKCIRCGGSFLLRGKTKLKDAEICTKCFRELGFDKGYDLISELYSYEEIKDGIDKYYENQQKKELIEALKDDPPFKISGAGNYEHVEATDGEIEMFDVIESILDGCELPAPLVLTRKSSGYVTAAVGEWDLARLKFTDRAKWIVLPVIESGSKKHYIEEPGDVNNFADELGNSLAHIRKYWQ